MPSDFCYEYCGDKYRHKSSLEIHLKKHGEVIMLKCKLCNYQGPRHLLRRRINNTHQVMKFECQKCEEQFSTKSNLGRHIKGTHEFQRFPCDVCNKDFSTKEKMNNHKLIHVNVKFLNTLVAIVKIIKCCSE